MTDLNQGQFRVADFSAAGELILSERYTYSALEGIPGAADLLGLFAGCLWRSPEGFDTVLPDCSLTARWRQTGVKSGIATFREADGNTLQVSVVLGGEDDDASQLDVLQRHLVASLQDTGFEPAFDLLSQTERPLLVSVAVKAPADPAARWAFSVADRCLAAAVFRKQEIETRVA